MARSSYIALLRGINVGGKNLLPMKSWASLLADLGCADVQTYIQSGNAVFQCEAALAAKLPQLLPKAILKAHGFEVPVVIRSAAELKKIVNSHPFLKKDSDLSRVFVAFLSAKPDQAAIARLDPDRSQGDRYQVIGSDIYIDLRDGAAKTKLSTQYFDSKLKSVSTWRNWNTVLKLLALAHA